MGQVPDNATEHNGLRLGCSFLFWLAAAAGVSLMTPSAYEPAAGIIGYLGFTGLGKQPETLFFALSMLAVPLLSIATSHVANRILGNPRRTASSARLRIATRIDRVVAYLSRKPFIVVLLGSATIYACFWTANIHVPLDFFHEGESLGPVSDVIHGKSSFVDVWYPHGWYYDIGHTLLAFQAGGGPSVEAFRGFSGALFPIGPIAYFLLCIAIAPGLRGCYIFLASVFCIAATHAVSSTGDLSLSTVPSYTFRVLIVSLSAAILLRWIDNQKIVVLALSGFIAGAGFLFQYDNFSSAFPLGCAVALVVGWSISGFRKAVGACAVFAAAGSVVPSVLLIWLATRDQAEQFVASLATTGRLLNHFDGLPIWPTQYTFSVVRYAPSAVLVICGSGVFLWLLTRAQRRSLSKEDLKLLCLVVLGLLFFMPRGLDRLDLSHQIYATLFAWPGLIVAGTRVFDGFLGERAGETQRWLTPAIGLTLSIQCAVMLFQFQSGQAGLLRAVLGRHRAFVAVDGSPYTQRLGNIDLPDIEQTEFLQTVSTYAESHGRSRGDMYILGNYGLLYFLLDRHNPTKYYQGFSMAVPFETQAEMVADLESADLELAMYSPDGADGIPTPVRLYHVSDYILHSFYPDHSTSEPDLAMLLPGPFNSIPEPAQEVLLRPVDLGWIPKYGPQIYAPLLRGTPLDLHVSPDRGRYLVTANRADSAPISASQFSLLELVTSSPSEAVASLTWTTSLGITGAWISFNVTAGAEVSHSLHVGSLPTWTWAGEIESLSVECSTCEITSAKAYRSTFGSQSAASD